MYQISYNLAYLIIQITHRNWEMSKVMAVQLSLQWNNQCGHLANKERNQSVTIIPCESILNPLSNKLELALLLLTYYIKNANNTFFKIICWDSTCSICSVSQSALDACAKCKLRGRKISAECILQNNITCCYHINIKNVIILKKTMCKKQNLKIYITCCFWTVF